MKRFALLAFTALTASLAGCGSSSDHHDMHGMHDMDMHSNGSSAHASDASAVDLHNTVCPVSDDSVADSKFTETYMGKIYHFCCDECPPKFKANPDKYARAVAADPKKYGVH